MSTYMRNCLSLFVLLSSTAIATTSVPEYVETDLEWSGFIEELGLDKEVKKLLKGIYDLNPSTPPRAMAQVASKLLKDLNTKYKTKISVDDGVGKLCEVLKQNQIRTNKNSVVFLREAFSHEYQKLSVNDMEGLYELMIGDWDNMSREEAQFLSKVFCGCLCLFIPVPLVQGAGAALISEAIWRYVENGAPR